VETLDVSVMKDSKVELVHLDATATRVPLETLAATEFPDTRASSATLASPDSTALMVLKVLVETLDVTAATDVMVALV
jgi:hypothetical protein